MKHLLHSQRSVRINLRATIPSWTWLIVAVAVAGCGKQATAPTDTSTAPPGQPEAATAASPASPRGLPTSTAAPAVVVPQNADMNATLSQLSLELRKYVVRTRSVPKDFEEFLAKSHAQVPPPPAGKKYAIQRQEVVLVNR